MSPFICLWGDALDTLFVTDRSTKIYTKRSEPINDENESHTCTELCYDLGQAIRHSYPSIQVKISRMIRATLRASTESPKSNITTASAAIFTQTSTKVCG